MIGTLLITATLLAQSSSTGVASPERQRELLAQINAKVARDKAAKDAAAKAKEATAPATAPAVRAEAEPEEAKHTATEAPQRTAPVATPRAATGTARTPTTEGTPYGYTATGIPTQEGPRGGIYHYSKNGNKVYEKQGSVGRIPSSTYAGRSSSSSRSSFGGSSRSSGGFSTGGSHGSGGGGHR